jgi:nucleoid-associated protein YgaU
MFDATGASPSSENKAGPIDSVSKSKALNAVAIDATQLIKASGQNPGQRHVNDAITEFFRITGSVKGATHQPNYLQINWGAFEFRGVLDSVSVNYKLFNGSGLPVRATVTANFVESITKEEEALIQKKTSPDLTHYRIVKEGDTLTLISQMIYGDTSYYMELAKINKLKNFRKLKVGQRIIIPPIDQKSKST